MSRNTKIVIVLLVAGSLLIGAISFMGARRSAAQTVQAVARVLKAEREVKKGDDDTIVTLAYGFGTGGIVSRARIDGLHVSEYPTGRQLVVCYDPDDPTSVRIAEGPCG